MPYTAIFQPRPLLATACAAAVFLSGCATRPEPEVTTTVQAAPVTPAVSTPEIPPAPEDGSKSRLDAQEFERWKQAFAAKAAAAGISPATVRNLNNARLRTSIVGFDRAQPEFTRTPWQYLDGAVSPLRIKNGKAKMQEASAALQAASKRYGVPATVIAAIWGMESNYGSNFGNFSTIDALATLAFEGRRAAWAEKELIAALRIIDKGDIDAAHMIGSWAGAMGHTQFMPSVFLQYAVDADGDGRRDIWGSMADVAASTANYVASSGWNSSEPWAVEVKLPASFDYARTELSNRQNSSAWAAEGVQGMNAQPLPAMAGASIIAPAGARGPAFMVGSNFRAILRYNNSTNYALGVGLLSQQLAGNGGVVADWPRDLAALSREQTRALQNGLNQRGFSAGSADGVMGPATRAGLRQFQQSQGLVADGYPTVELLQRLQAAQ
ncbi:lytic murein transglycosylase [Comamonas testosteroni]|uniref:Lytic murein transglycosylase n=1 Tax=Comamonas testosteroni TaxID=285 RepID=A0A373FJG7_COMTE|nr:lytic murein transglycosylase [Comamonas testosteroni]RGE44253.1 lytic murein transglycosylase [Comamonas testosteroni]